MTASTHRIAGLDGIRALAVTAVVWHHAHSGYAALPITHNGFLGVDAFFVLSGFLITTLLLQERARTGGISLTNFYARRALRIFPLYYALLALLAVYFGLSHASAQREAFLHALPWHALYLSNFASVDSLMAITWSLSTEEQFYLLWPPLLALLRPRWALGVILAFIGLNQALNFGAFDAALRARGVPYESLEILQITFTPILLGVVLAFVLQSPTMRLHWSRALPAWALWLCTGLLLLFCNVDGSLRGGPRLAVHLTLTVLLALVVLHPRHAIVRALEWRPLIVIGTVSYGVYLLHKLGLDFARRLLARVGLDDGVPLFALGFALTMVLAMLSFRYLEQPMLKRKRAFATASPRPSPSLSDRPTA